MKFHNIHDLANEKHISSSPFGAQGYALPTVIHPEYLDTRLCLLCMEMVLSSSPLSGGVSMVAALVAWK